MKENKSNAGYWNDWARYEAIDSGGQIWQYENKPTLTPSGWDTNANQGKSDFVGNIRIGEPKDHSKTLIERYPSESETAPFTFGPEHVGKRVRHVDGSKGIVLAVELSRSVSDQLVIKLNVGEGESVQIVCYSLEGKVFASDKDAVIFLDESETAPAETASPDLQAKVKELERFSLGVISDNIKIRASIEKAEARIEALEVDVKELRESREMVHRFVPARTYLDDMHFVVPGAKSDVGVFSFTGGIETPAEPDPTAQKIEALKLLFSWRDGCEFMTVDGRDGHVWQWTVAPVKGESNCWTALGSDPQARRVGEIGLDPELCQILIKRNDGE